jgi:hypothetical protein
MSLVVAHPQSQVEQVLFVTRMPDGRRIAFAFLDDGRCAVLCNDRIEHACDGDETGVSSAFERFCKMTHLGAQRHDGRDMRPS